MSFGTRLSLARKNKGLTQADVGVGLATDGGDASKSVVYGWEKDQHYPRVDQLTLICKRLGCGADYLLFGVQSLGWPFAPFLLDRVLALSDADRGYVEGRLEAAVESRELSAAVNLPTADKGLPDSSVAHKTDAPKRHPGELYRTVSGSKGGSSEADRPRPGAKKRGRRDP